MGLLGKKRWIFLVLLVGRVFLTAIDGAASGAPLADGKDATSFFAGLGPGWNLGNTLDAHQIGFSADTPEEYESLWKNPPACAELFEVVYAAGFRTVRIPVTWYPHLDARHRINEAWMARVRQVVDYALSANLYVILNVHHDSWYSPFEHNLDAAETKLVLLWSQICGIFADYDERLIFESMNEPRLEGEETEWTGTTEARAGVNRLNQAFVETVRSAGGNHLKRYLLVPPYAAMCMPEAFGDFAMPEDDRVGVSIHMYLPIEFALNGEEERWSVDDEDDSELITLIFELIDSTFVACGTPVVITEYGALDSKNTEDRVAWATFIGEKARELSISCIWWDNGCVKPGNPLGTFALLNRDDLTWYHPEIVRVVTARSETRMDGG